MALDHTPSGASAEELFQNAPCGYLAADADGTLVQVNESFLRMTGYAREALLAGKRFTDLLTLPGRIYHDTHFGPLLQMQGFAREVAFEMVRADEHRLPILVSASRQTFSSGLQLTLIMVFDATDRRQYEKELLLARRRAEEASESERAAKERAEVATRSKDDFLAMVSHELRTPLNAILGWTHLLQSDQSLTDDLRDGLSVIHRNAQVQADLINDLLDMSRIASGKLRLNVQDVPLADAIEAAINTALPAAMAKNIRVQKILDPAVLVSGDPGRLQQIFWNLLTNAVKFTQRAGTIRIVMRRVNSHVETSVIDDGQGMTPEFLTHAFEMFRQSNNAGNQQLSGLGLGLPIVKRLVEMHGGTITAMSAGLNAGSTFRVDLPVNTIHQQVDGPERAHPRNALTGDTMLGTTNLSGITVLVVDDEPDAREMVRRVLRGVGAEVIVADSAAAALALLETSQPNVLVSDIGMPDTDGFELIRNIRMMGQDKGRIRAIALTAFARLEDRTRAMLAGFQMHLSKPVDARELIAAIATLAAK